MSPHDRFDVVVCTTPASTRAAPSVITMGPARKNRATRDVLEETGRMTASCAPANFAGACRRCFDPRPACLAEA